MTLQCAQVVKLFGHHSEVIHIDWGKETTPLSEVHFVLPEIVHWEPSYHSATYMEPASRIGVSNIETYQELLACSWISTIWKASKQEHMGQIGGRLFREGSASSGFTNPLFSHRHFGSANTAGRYWWLSTQIHTWLDRDAVGKLWDQPAWCTWWSINR